MDTLFEFVTIIGFENYEITNSGVIRNRKTRKVLRTSIQTKGYLKVDLYRNKKRHTKYIHRLVAENFIDNKAGKDTVNHKDKNKKNNHESNLEWVTNLENIYHRDWYSEPFLL